MTNKININQENENSLDKNKKSNAKLEAERKYGADGIGELKIRDSKNDPVLFYLINAIDKDVRMEACREILKRALTDIYYGINETELVKQEDLVEYINKKNVKGPTKHWLFTTDSEIKEPVIIIEKKEGIKEVEEAETIKKEEEIIKEEVETIEEIQKSELLNDIPNHEDEDDNCEDYEDYEDDDDDYDEFEDNGL